MDRAGYERWVTLTSRLTPSSVRQAMARAAHLFRRAVGRWEWIWSIEVGPRTGMVHAHACCRAPYIPQAVLSKKAVDAGWGKVAWIEDARHLAGAYSAKCAGYSDKGVWLWPEWMAANGGKRTWHWSREYMEMPARDWMRYWAPAIDRGPWEVVPAHTIGDVSAWRVERDAESEQHARTRWPRTHERAFGLRDLVAEAVERVVITLAGGVEAELLDPADVDPPMSDRR